MPTPDAALPTAAPQDLGLDPDALETASGLLDQALAAGQLSAASLVVARRGAIGLARGYGTLRPESGAPAVDAESVFLLASITKPVTAVALMRLVESGQVSLNDPVARYLPEYTGGQRHLIKVRHLLHHISGMPDMLPENTALRQANEPLEEFVRRALCTPLLFTPTTDFSYQSKGILLAAEIVQRQTSLPLRQFEQETIFAPLGMDRSALGLGPFEIADTVWCGTNPEETDEQQSWGHNSPYWRNIGCPWGGMHSCGPDLAILMQTMLEGGQRNGYRLLSPATARTMVTDQNGSLGKPWGLGWALAGSSVWNYFGELVSPATFGHVGSTGTVAWADPQQQLICVVLTNQMVEEGSLLRRVSNAVAAAVVDYN